MTTDAESEHSRGFFNRENIAGALLAGSAIGIQILVPLVWPNPDRLIGRILVLTCAFALVLGVALLWLGQRKRTVGALRRWNVVGVGQGWVESRIRNNSGDQIVISWSAGSDADQISICVAFGKRSKPRRSEVIELLFDIDGQLFEWDTPDPGGPVFTLEGSLWRDLEAIKSMLVVMRQGHSLSASVPTLGLRARFTLEGAFDTLEEAAVMSDLQGPQSR